MARFEGTGTCLPKPHVPELAWSASRPGPAVWTRCPARFSLRDVPLSPDSRHHLAPAATALPGPMCAGLEIQRIRATLCWHQLRELPGGAGATCSCSRHEPRFPGIQPGGRLAGRNLSCRGNGRAMVAWLSTRSLIPRFTIGSVWPWRLRGQQISDFPLCNKSFNLSYCGHDLVTHG